MQNIPTATACQVPVIKLLIITVITKAQRDTLLLTTVVHLKSSYSPPIQ
jgi:hypothetical protein